MESNGNLAISAPNGSVDTKCDEKGRLKLPAKFLAYLKALDVDKVFITTIDLKLARIYPESVWQGNLNRLENAGEDAGIAEQVMLIANHYGEDSEIDGQGRVLIPSNLRRDLGIEGQTVWIDFYNGAINVASQKTHGELMEQAKQNFGAKVLKLKQKGFK